MPISTVNHGDMQQRMDALVNGYLDRKAFSACSLGFVAARQGETCRDAWYYGTTGFAPGDSAVSGDTCFDLASLTKPMVTALAVLLLASSGTVKFDDRLVKYFPKIASDKADISLRQLINHTSGLSAHQPYYLELIQLPQEERRDFLIAKILGEKLCNIPGTNCLYSDLGFILLGWIVEQVSGLPLDRFFEKHILEPLAIDRTQIFFIPQGHTFRLSRQAAQRSFKKQAGHGASGFAATGICPWSGQVLRGTVHDDNCRALGGVAGHAGLFATLAGTLAWIEGILAELQGKSCRLGLSEEILQGFRSRESGSGYIYGFDTPSLLGSSSGRYFFRLSFGHLGFTGTSLWMDLSRGCGIVLLTNRILAPDGLQAIKTLRPEVHDLIMGYLASKE